MSTSTTSRRARLRACAALATVALAVSACGSSDDATDEVVEEGGRITDVTIEASGEPQRGGSLDYGVEAETDGWNPASSQWAISGHLIGMAIFDPLAAYDADGGVKPYLAESFESSEGDTLWTIGVRDGVTFHDGSPCDAAAIVKALESLRASVLTKGALAPIESIEAVDESTIEVRMKTPWSSFPAILTTQVGFVAAPAQLDATGPESTTEPIGTGPFRFEEWVPDSELRVSRNDDYWQEGLPYLDEITFHPISDPSARHGALLSGDLEVIHSVTNDSIADMAIEARNGEIQLIVDPTEQEEYFLMPNQGRPPFDDVRARLAVAHAIDREEYLDVFGAGVAQPASGPFVPGSEWFAETEVPAYDPEEATRLVEEYEAEKGPIVIELGATNDPITRASVQSFVEDLEAVGIEATASFTEQAQQIGAVVGGEYDLVDWRQFGAPDPDADYMWWHSGTGEPGTIDLNLAKIQNPELDAALDEGRTTSDPEVRKQAYATVQREMAENAHYIWLSHTQWAIGARNQVRDIANGPLPGGSPSLPFGAQVPGVHRLTQTWLASD